MKKLWILFILAFFAMACNNASDQIGKENVAVVENYIKAVEAMDHEAMGKYLADNYTGYGPSYGDTIYKIQAIEYWKEHVANLYESIHYNRSKCAPLHIDNAEPENNGDWVINWAELNIIYKNTGKDVTIWAVSSYQIKDGKISKSITVYNEADALKQLGFQLVPAEQQ